MYSLKGMHDFVVCCLTSPVRLSFVNAADSKLFTILLLQIMAEIHLRSMQAKQSKSDADNRFGDRNLLLAVCTCFIRNCGHCEVIRDFRSLCNGGNPD
jgi:hypothetical protein